MLLRGSSGRVGYFLDEKYKNPSYYERYVKVWFWKNDPLCKTVAEQILEIINHCFVWLATFCFCVLSVQTGLNIFLDTRYKNPSYYKRYLKVPCAKRLKKKYWKYIHHCTVLFASLCFLTLSLQRSSKDVVSWRKGFKETWC